MRKDYSKIINLPHHRSATRPHMSREDRAAQFSPFSALTGLGAAIDETARETISMPELSEDEKENIDRALQDAVANPEQALTITYFVPDAHKEGGSFCTVTGPVKKLDPYDGTVQLMDERKIRIKTIVDVLAGE